MTWIPAIAYSFLSDIPAANSPPSDVPAWVNDPNTRIKTVNKWLAQKAGEKGKDIGTLLTGYTQNYAGILKSVGMCGTEQEYRDYMQKLTNFLNSAVIVPAQPTQPQIKDEYVSGNPWKLTNISIDAGCYSRHTFLRQSDNLVVETEDNNNNNRIEAKEMIFVYYKGNFDSETLKRQRPIEDLEKINEALAQFNLDDELNKFIEYHPNPKFITTDKGIGYYCSFNERSEAIPKPDSSEFFIIVLEGIGMVIDDYGDDSLPDHVGLTLDNGTLVHLSSAVQKFRARRAASSEGVWCIESGIRCETETGPFPYNPIADLQLKKFERFIKR